MTSGVLVGDYLWLPPRDGFWPSDSAGFVNVGLFLIASSGIIWASRLLRAERDRASAYFDVAGTIVVTISAKGPVRAINRSGLDLLGCEDEDAVIGHQWVDGFVPTVDREVFATALDQARRGDSGVQCEARIRRADMTERLIKWRLAMYRRVDRRALVVAVGEDVTEERKTASALRESEGRLRAVLRQVPGAVTILAAPHGTLIIRSDRTSEILGHASFGEAALNLQQYGGEHADGRSYTSEEYPIVRALGSVDI